MPIATISVPLDAEAAQIYNAASVEEQEKLCALISFWLREFNASPKPLKVLMDEISDKAEKRGLTPQILDSLLRDD